MIIAATGHRPKDLFGYQSEKPYEALQHLIEEALADIARQNGLSLNAIELRTGGAQGADQTAFHAGKDIGCISHVFIPFIGQDSRWQKDGLFGQSAYQRMLREADHITIVERIERFSHATSVAQKLMYRNEAMLDGADVLLAICKHDDWMTQKSGTAATMRKAMHRSIPIYRINPMTGEHGWICGTNL